MRGRVHGTDEVFVGDGDAGYFVDTESNHQALVVASLFLTLGMQRHRYQVVDALEERCVLDAFADLLAEKHPCIFVAFVFQLVDDVLHLARLGEKESGSDGMETHTTIEDLCHRVVGVEFISCARQGIAAFQANGVFILEQRLATSGANARIKQVEDAVEPVAECHDEKV